VQRDYSNEKLYNRAIEYLLGQLSEQEESDFEADYFEDFALYEQVQAIEEDLIEDYFRERLTQDHRVRFENHYMSLPGRQEQIDFARTLLQSLEPAVTASLPVKAPSTSLSWQMRTVFFPRTLAKPFVIMAIVALIALSIWLAIETRRLRGRLEAAEQKSVEHEKVKKEIEQQLEKQRSDNNSIASELQQARDRIQQIEAPGTRPAKPGASVLSFVLSFASTRGGSTPQKIQIGPGTSWIDLKLDIGDSEFEAYNVVVRHLPGGVILSKKAIGSIGPTGRFVTIRLPARRVVAGNYVISMDGITERRETKYIGEYSFAIIRR
jgi:hypothetical protein